MALDFDVMVSVAIVVVVVVVVRLPDGGVIKIDLGCVLLVGK